MMRFSESLQLVNVHCQGEIGRVIVGGVGPIPGATLLDKMNHLNGQRNGLRRFVTFEPRGGPNMSTNLLVPPTAADADAGFIVFQPDRAHAMSGSNAICVVTALLETGRLPMLEPETLVRLDTPAGVVAARARCAGGRCLSVSIDNVPSFAVELDVDFDAPDYGKIKLDIAFGGEFFALIDVAQLGLRIEPAAARQLVQAGMAIQAAARRAIPVHHPERPELNGVAYVMFRDVDEDGTVHTCTALPPGRADRSPCGTGSCANLATLYARGVAGIGETRVSRSIIGSEFQLEALEETKVGGFAAIRPRVTGSAWIYGTETLRADPSDPLPLGYLLSDSV